MGKLSAFRLPFREDKLFSLLAFTVFLVPLAFSVFNHENFETIKLVLFLVCLGFAVILFIKNSTSPLVLAYHKFLYAFLAVFLGTGLFSAILSIDKVYSFFGFYYRFTGSFLFYFAFALFIFLLINSLNREKFYFLIKILCLDVLVISVFGFMQSLGISFYGGLEAAGLQRAPGLLGNPNFTGMFLASVLPYVILMFAESKSLAARLYYGIGVFFILLSVLALSSRGAVLAILLGLVFSGLLLLIFRFEKKYLFWLGAAFLFGIVFSVSILGISRPQAFSSIFKQADQNTIFRISVWQVSLKGIIKHPFLGTGPGTYAIFFEQNQNPKLASVAGVFDDAHNLFLQMAVTTGLPFLASFLGLFGLACYFAWQRLKTEKDLFTVAGVTALFVWAVGVCFNPVPIPMFILLAVILSGLFLHKLEPVKISFSNWAKRFGFIGGIILIFFGVVLIVAEQIFYFAEMAYINGQSKTTYKLSMISEKINPTNPIYSIYKIASSADMNFELKNFEINIENFIAQHPLQARTYVEASNFYGLMFHKSQNYYFLAKAIQNLQEALKLDPYYPARYGQLALYYFQMGNMTESKALAQKSLELKKDDFSNWLLLAKIYQSEGNREETVNSLTRAFNIRTDLIQLRLLIEAAKNAKNIKDVPIQISVRRPDLN